MRIGQSKITVFKACRKIGQQLQFMHTGNLLKKRIFNIIRDCIASSCRVKCILRESESIVWRSYFLSEIGQCMVHMQPRLPTGA